MDWYEFIACILCVLWHFKTKNTLRFEELLNNKYFAFCLKNYTKLLCVLSCCLLKNALNIETIAKMSCIWQVCCFTIVAYGFW